MIAGRKLLLADDSAAIQKVIELTFADEGMQVFSVGNGRLALETLEQVAPDVVLADVFMPELSGYDLCRSIKQNERFAQTPVMLLVSSFEPFDEDEARRAGADDIVAKPFQSIRQLVSRVGTLLGKSESEESPQSFSTLGLSSTQAPTIETSTELAPVASHEPKVTVLVEAPQMESHEIVEPSGPTCAPDIEVQTADTQKLERITDEPLPIEAEEWQLQDTVEIEPVTDELRNESPSAVAIQSVSSEPTTEPDSFVPAPQAMSEPVTYVAPEPVRAMDDSLLDVDEEFLSPDGDDMVLDLEFENAIDEAPVALAAYSPVEDSQPEESQSQIGAGQDIEPISDVEPIREERMESTAAVCDNAKPIESQNASAEELPPDAIDAIARRVMERMSEKVVREIAWEVVPELSELLIKQKLNDQR